MTRLSRLSFALAAPILLAITFWAFVANAQSYPDRPIRVIVPIAPGSVTDIIMRATAAELAPRIGQTFVIENKGGASGIPAAQSCAQAAPDGYTLCLVYHNTISINPLMFNKLPYDAEKDFTLITNLYLLVEALFVSSSLNVKTAGELKAYVQANPRALNYGTLGPGSNPEMFLKWMNQQWNASIVGIPYRGGGPIAQALVAGELQIAKMGLGNFLGLLDTGKIKPLAVAADAALEARAGRADARGSGDRLSAVRVVGPCRAQGASAADRRQAQRRVREALPRTEIRRVSGEAGRAAGARHADGVRGVPQA